MIGAVAGAALPEAGSAQLKVRLERTSTSPMTMTADQTSTAQGDERVADATSRATRETVRSAETVADREGGGSTCPRRAGAAPPPDVAVAATPPAAEATTTTQPESVDGGPSTTGPSGRTRSATDEP